MPIRITNQITQARRIVKKALHETLNSAANAHVVFSQFICPVKTGRLRDGIKQTQQATEAKPEAIVESQAPYSAAVEWGTATTPADPFFVPGMELGKKRIQDEGYKVREELQGLSA